MAFEVESEISSKHVKFFNIDSSTRFSTSKVGFVIPKNDYIKINHQNEDLIKAEKDKEKLNKKVVVESPV